jgi:hypothetical protein
VVTTLVRFVSGSIRIRRESLHPRNIAPLPAAIWSHPRGVAMRVTCPVEGSMRSAVRGSTVQTDPDPTARFCAPTADGLAEKTFEIRSTTCPTAEIFHRELPLRAHSEPKPATRLEGCGTETERRPELGVAVAVGVGVVELVVGDMEVAVGGWGETGEVEDVVHAVSSTAIEQR